MWLTTPFRVRLEWAAVHIQWCGAAREPQHQQQASLIKMFYVFFSSSSSDLSFEYAFHLFDSFSTRFQFAAEPWQQQQHQRSIATLRGTIPIQLARWRWKRRKSKSHNTQFKNCRHRQWSPPSLYRIYWSFSFHFSFWRCFDQSHDSVRSMGFLLHLHQKIKSQIHTLDI